ncbi:hypothetical protein [Mycobacterium numidiamassiliense]|uniref:hypothetical protein n=1 Tax=Mycobacterium numidiamassiliense TaxID=1841861 RepID=UPI00097D694C|nr:hypothetical protein [Mycobacterium numidiamassiliense]
MAPNGPPDEFNDQPTRHINIGGQQPPSPPPGPLPTPGDQPAPFGSLDPFEEEPEPIEWYRRPVVLIAWGIFVLILIALIVYGIMELVQDQGTSSVPSSTTTTSTTTPTTTTSSSATETTTPPPTTTAPTTTTSSTPPPPAQQPTYTQQQPTRRHHWPSWLPTAVPGLS